MSVILAAVTLIYLGVIIIWKSRLCHWADYCISFTGYNLPVGSVLLIVGIYLFWSEIRKRNKKRKEGR